MTLDDQNSIFLLPYRHIPKPIMPEYATVHDTSYLCSGTIRPRLIFTKAASKGIHQIDHVQEWKRESILEMKEAMKGAVKK